MLSSVIVIADMRVSSSGENGSTPFEGKFVVGPRFLQLGCAKQASACTRYTNALVGEIERTMKHATVCVVLVCAGMRDMASYAG